MTEITDFKLLVGKKKLSGVDVTSQSVNGEDVTSVVFILDKVKYKVIEDLNDGYRSSACSPEIVRDKVKNSFPSVDVLCRHKTKGYNIGEDDILELLSLKTGQTILEIGTHNIDDYYPSFVCNFSAEAIGTV